MKNKIKIRIIIAGSRDFSDYNYLKKELDSIIADVDKSEIEIISGHARGADALGERYAFENRCQLKIMPAQWSKYGRIAGFMRNNEMLRYIQNSESNNMVVIFWDGKSHGTKHMITAANNKNVKTYIFIYD